MSRKKPVQPTNQKLDIKNQPSSHWINIWVHGTRLTPTFFYKQFFHVDRGLNKATDLDAKYHHREIAETLSAIDQYTYNVQSFYLFGWSGKLSFKKRKQASQELYKALNQLSNEYAATHGVRPKIRVITHSHGGNVALNMAHYAHENPEFSLEELVLLACPVQEQTQYLIENSYFKTIYSFYSTRDVLQVIDPQGIYFGEYESIDFDRSLFSQRRFPENSKLKQIEVRYHDRGILHIEFLLIKKLAGFIEHLPNVLQTVAKCPESHQTVILTDDD